MAASISSVIITKDEEANIRRCLESVRWADEIVVVDCGSTDGTLEICKEYDCRVFNHEWEGYARQKNFALGEATCDWVLSLDADEEVSPELAEEIRVAVESGDADAYTMPRKSLFLGKWMRHGGWYPDRQLKVFRRGAGRFRIVPLHEYVELSDPSARTGGLENALLHHTYPTVGDFLRRMESYASIEAETAVQEGKLPGWPLLALLGAFPLKFLETYIYKSGWRDGVHGFIAAMLLSTRVFVRHVKIWEASASVGEK